MKRTFLAVAVVGFGLWGCGGTKGDADDGDGGAADDGTDEGPGGEFDGDGGGNDDDGGQTSGADDGQADDGAADSGGADDGMMDDGADDDGGSDGPGSFITMPDGGNVANECDQWVQDCPEGEKCMPWANDGGSAWNATRCSPVSDNPGQVGDECMTEGSGVSGLDSCDVGSMCYYVDPETNTGTCVGFCLGTPDAPQCDPGFLCSISNDGVLTLCRAECDPLLQDCDDAACLPAAGADGFVCIVDASGEAGVAGDPCEYLNSCDPGLWCAAADAVPGCAGAQGCCTEFCDLTVGDPDAACSQAAQGSACEPWFEEGQAPPDLGHVGACVLPA